jgi:hypothetical protein
VLKFHAHTRFELLATDGNKPAGPQTIQVAANGASRIQFIVLPLPVVVSDLATLGQAGYAELYRIAPRINGVPLLPALIVQDYDNNPPAPDRNVTAAWMPSERFDMSHSATVHDMTIYELTWPGGNANSLNTSPLVMVIRTFTEPAR